MSDEELLDEGLLKGDFSHGKFKPHFRIWFCSIRKAFYVSTYNKHHDPTLMALEEEHPPFRQTLFLGDPNSGDSHEECVEWCKANMPAENEEA